MTAVAAHDDGAKAKDALDRSDARWLRLQEIIRAHSSQRRQSHSCNGVNERHHSRRHLNLTRSRSCCDLESSCAMKAARSEREVIRLRDFATGAVAGPFKFGLGCANNAMCTAILAPVPLGNQIHV